MANSVQLLLCSGQRRSPTLSCYCVPPRSALLVSSHRRADEDEEARLQAIFEADQQRLRQLDEEKACARRSLNHIPSDVSRSQPVALHDDFSRAVDRVVFLADWYVCHCSPCRLLPGRRGV